MRMIAPLEIHGLPPASLRKYALGQVRFDDHRRQTLGRYLSREVPWAILITLYSQVLGRRNTISNLAVTIDAPMTTVLRWLNVLETHGLIQRFEHPFDRRAAMLELTEKSEEIVERLLAERIKGLM